MVGFTNNPLCPLDFLRVVIVFKAGWLNFVIPHAIVSDESLWKMAKIKGLWNYLGQGASAYLSEKRIERSSGINERGQRVRLSFLVTGITFYVTYLGRVGELVELEQLNHYMQWRTCGNRFLNHRPIGKGIYSNGLSADNEHRLRPLSTKLYTTCIRRIWTQLLQVITVMNDFLRERAVRSVWIWL